MYFAGRWVPMEVMNAILVLWAIAVVVVGAWVWWLRRKTPPAKSKIKPQSVVRRHKHRRRKA